MLRAAAITGSIAVACLSLGCGSSRALTKQLADYIAHHVPPLSAQQIDRLYAREALLGDPLELVQAMFEGAELTLSHESPAEAIASWELHVPYGGRGGRLGRPGQPSEVFGENGHALLTFDHKVLKAYVILDPGIK